MVVLKRLKAASLMETLIATILIMVIFMLSSLILNNLFSNAIKKDKRAITAELNKLEYLYLNNQLQTPLLEEYGMWLITIKREDLQKRKLIILEAEHTENNDHIRRQLYD